MDLKPDPDKAAAPTDVPTPASGACATSAQSSDEHSIETVKQAAKNAIEIMKHGIGFTLENNYKGHDINSMFNTLVLFIGNEFTKLSKDETFANCSSISSSHSPLSANSAPANDDNLTTEDTNTTALDNNTNPESGTVCEVETIPTNDTRINDPTAIDVASIITEDDAIMSNYASDDDSSHAGTSSRTKQQKGKETKRKHASDDDDRIRIPDIDKELSKVNALLDSEDDDLIDANDDDASVQSKSPADNDLQDKTAVSNEVLGIQLANGDFDITALDSTSQQNDKPPEEKSEDHLPNPFENNLASCEEMDDLFNTCFVNDYVQCSYSPSSIEENSIEQMLGDDANVSMEEEKADAQEEIKEDEEEEKKNDAPNSGQNSDDSDVFKSDDDSPKPKNFSDIAELVKISKALINSSDDEAEMTEEETKPAVLSESKDDDSKSTAADGDSDDENSLNSLRGRGRTRKRLLDSDEDGDNDEEEDIGVPRKKKVLKNSNTESLDSGGSDSESDSDSLLSSKKNNKRNNLKRKRKRVVAPMSDDDDDDDDEDAEKSTKSGSGSDVDTPTKSRKNIKKILSDKRLQKETKDAEKAERERRRRIEEKQKLYNQLAAEFPAQSSQIDQVVLDIDKETKEILVQVEQSFVKHLKPHQVAGIKFLFDCTIESVERLEKNDHSSGCILAHSMGLGKTFQIVAFLHSIMTNARIKEKIKRVLIIVPKNVIQNWANEFDKWFEECGLEQVIPIYSNFYESKASERIPVLRKWHKGGGILLITSKLMSNLVNAKVSKKTPSAYKEYLIDPGPDMVIIDEGHLLKNDQGAFNRAVSPIKTLRRIILTGTPLQNNLGEYFTMISFVKPNLLGSKKEFKNRFENPIKNGQHIDSTERDVKVMKKRVHILHQLLKDCIHRCDYSVLVPYLQPKFEYVLSLKLTETQTKLYKHYLENLVDKSSNTRRLFHDHTILGYIWNHPVLLRDHYNRKQEENEEEDANSMDDFIVDESSASETLDSESSEDCKLTEKKKRKKRSRIVLKPDESDDDSEIECVYQKTTRSTPQDQKNLIELKDLENSRILRDGKVLEDRNFPTKDWFEAFLPDNPFDLNLSVKFTLLFSILEKCEVIGDKILVFSQSLTTLDLIEEFLSSKMDEFSKKHGHDLGYDDLTAKTDGISHRWIPNLDYFRIDGQVASQIRSNIIDKFNDPENHRARLMLVSTRAGGIGINLVGANRCIIFDTSWNPSNDMQAIYRIFRYGQRKPVYVYRFTAGGTMESKIYERQIIKQSLSHRVVDEQQIQRHFKAADIGELYTFTDEVDENRKMPAVPKDILLADIFLANKDLIINYHEHDSLLENRPDEELTEEERKAAWDEYETEKERGFAPPDPIQMAPNNIQFNPALNSQYNNQQQFFPWPGFTPPNPHQLQNIPFERWPEQTKYLYVQQQMQFRLQQQQHQSRPQLSSLLQQTPQHQPSTSSSKHISPQPANGYAQHKSAFDDFFASATRNNVVTVKDDFKACINLNTILTFDGRDLSFFEEHFNSIAPADCKTSISKAKSTMYYYLEKCLDISNIYQAQMKNYRPPLSNHPIFNKLVRSSQAIAAIHFEFVKKYKETFQNIRRNKPTPSTSNGFAPQRSILNGTSATATIQECITISDDEQ